MYVSVRCETLRSRALRIDARARAVKSARANLGICSVSISRIIYLLQRRAARRLYTGMVASNLNETHQSSMPVHRQSNNPFLQQPSCAAFVPLRVIEATFAGSVKAECILDSGSQFIAMRRDIWEKTGLSLNPVYRRWGIQRRIR